MTKVQNQDNFIFSKEVKLTNQKNSKGQPLFYISKEDLYVPEDSTIFLSYPRTFHHVDDNGNDVYTKVVNNKHFVISE